MKTMTDKIALATTIWVALAGAYVALMHPDRRWQCLLGMAVLGLAWTLRQAFHRKAQANPASVEAQRSITQSIIFAGLLLSVGLAEALGWIDASGEFRVRACQFLAGAMVMLFANVIPKKAVSSPRLAALLRANGRVLFLGGLGYALAWLVLPLEYAQYVALSAMALAFAYVVARMLACAIRKNGSTPPSGSA